MTLPFRRDDAIPLPLLITTAVRHVLSLSAFLASDEGVGRPPAAWPFHTPPAEIR